MSRNRGRERHRHGSSLLEIVISATFFTVIMMAIAQTSLAVKQANTYSAEKSAAMAAASERLEQLKRLADGELLLAHDSEFTVERALDNRSFDLVADDSDGRNLPGKVSVVPIANGHMLKIEISVRWLSEGGPAQFSLSCGRQTGE